MNRERRLFKPSSSAIEEEDEKKKPTKLNLNTPLLSVRRSRAATAPSASHSRENSLISNVDATPIFGWEHSLCKSNLQADVILHPMLRLPPPHKVRTHRLHKLSNSNVDLSEEEEMVSEVRAADGTCLVSLNDGNEQQKLPVTDPAARDFIMHRFLIAAKAMAAPLTESSTTTNNMEMQMTKSVRTSTNVGRQRKKVSRRIEELVMAAEREWHGESESLMEGEDVHCVGACGILPLNKIAGVLGFRAATREKENTEKKIEAGDERKQKNGEVGFLGLPRLRTSMEEELKNTRLNCKNADERGHCDEEQVFYLDTLNRVRDDAARTRYNWRSDTMTTPMSKTEPVNQEDLKICWKEQVDIYLPTPRAPSQSWLKATTKRTVRHTPRRICNG